MLFKGCLLHKDNVLPEQVIFSILVSLSHKFLIYVIYFAIIIFITINQIISVILACLFFGHVCQKFNLRVLLRFYLNANFSLALLIKVLPIKKACSVP